MISAAIATAPKSLKISLERTPFFIRPDLDAVSNGELWSDMMRKHASSQSKKAIARDPARDLAAGDALGGLLQHCNQADVGAGMARFEAGLNVLPDGYAPIEFDFDVEMSSSLDAQRLLLWAGGISPAARERLCEKLARGHFAERKRCSDRAWLVASAAAAGLDREKATRYLESGRDEDYCRQQFLRVMYGWGYEAVPVTLVSCEGHHFEIRGAQSMEHYVALLKEAAAAPPGNPSAKASWETMNAKCVAAQDWPALERRVFSRRDCGGLLKTRR